MRHRWSVAVLLAEPVFAVEIEPSNGRRQFVAANTYAPSSTRPKLWHTRSGAEKEASSYRNARVVEFNLAPNEDPA